MKLQRVKGWWFIRLALTLVGKKGIGELKRASKNALKAQEKTLRGILGVSKNTVYGREHHFDDILKAAGPEELFARYRKQVPVNDYENFQPYIERHKQGESDVLFAGNPKMYATTSGTTREPKWIPITEQYYQEVYKAMNQLWFYTLIMNKPRAFYGKTLSVVGSAIEGAAPDGTVYGSISGISQRDIPNFMEVLHPAPADIFHITDYKARYYTIMRMGIEQDITLIITANPSTLVEMQNNVNEFYDEYVEDIENGTLSRRVSVSREIRAALEKRIRPNPRRAAELRALKFRYGKVLPKHYWPNLQIVNVWFCGNTKIFFDKIADSFPESCFFHEMGYYATECRPGIVLKSNSPDTVIFGHKIFFEFIHESELESKNPRIYRMDEVKKGERYCMVVTTSAGLYRYNMNDLVEITGFVNQFPTLKLIQKVNGTVNMTGEKLHERQFVEAVHAAEQDTGNRVAFFVGFADASRAVYRFYYEFVNADITQEKAENFTRVLDGYLKQFNIEYEAKRSSNRLKNPETSLLVNESFEKFKSACIDKGYRDGQFKVNLLMQDEKRHAMFKELVR
ncbi:MAG: GH3 auxin-responsive promoter family protein [Spirochaetaceae bacterium]|jgi:hypothetical protein|nr:GH3 auxin-responsive promoter family protein [Spirochaetaceae bacterium]